ncbi:MAG TPA: AsmA-like C-terminal region-containing protein [Bacteroidia bacterium]|nr:AsmA-like C-terminal region-containing protein [Bacteroidia bacterium]
MQEISSQRSPLKTAKKFFLYFLIAFAGIIILAAVFSLLYSKEIKQYVINSISKNLDTEIKVGAVDFSIFSKFPYASVDFKDVMAKEPERLHTNDTLLEAKEFSLLFNIMDLISKKYNLKKIILKDASLHLKINKDGENNYEVWKKDSASSADSDFKMELEKLEMKNVHVNYKSIKAEQDYAFQIQDGILSGNFSSDKYTVRIKANMMVEKLVSEKVNWVKQKVTGIDLALAVDSKKHLYTIENSDINIAGLNLVVSGTIHSPEGYAEYDLATYAKKADLKSLLSVIPYQYAKELDGYSFKGNVYFKSSIKGRSDKKQKPVFIIDFGTENSAIAPKNSEFEMKEIKLKGHYTSRKTEKNPVSYLHLENIQSVLQGQKIMGNFEISNFKDPVLHIEADASADLSALSKFIRPDTLEKISGGLVLKNVVFRGKVNDISSYISSGNINLADVSFKLKQKPVVFNNVQGDLVFNKNNLKVNALSGNTPLSDFSFTGNLDNFFGYFFAKNQKLNIDAALQCEKLDLNEIMEKDASSSLNDTVYKITFADDLAFTIRVNVNQIHFNKFHAAGLRGTIQLQNSELATHALQFNSMDGSIYLQGSIREINGDSLVIQYDASIKKLDITQLFFQMGNFGQNTITDKNLKGSVTADVQFLSKWSNTLNCNLDKVNATANLTIENGQLVNFAPMRALSKYVKGADLNDVKFSTLKNTVEIKNRKVMIPSMEINSTALNIVASGTHGFDNMIDYHLQLLLSQLLGKKVKSMNTEFGTIEDDNLGKTKLFVSMKGPANNPKFSYDSKGMQEKIMVNIAKEKQNLKEILKKEFSKNKEDQPVKKDSPKKQEELQIETDDEK